MPRGVPNNTIHGGVWGDPDFQLLARALGLDRPADAIGRFAHLEHHCLTRQTTVVTTRMVDLIMGTGGAEALVALGMAVDVEGGIELGGRTAEKVAQWVAVRDRASAGGHARHEQAKQSGARSPSGRFSSGDDNHPSPAPADDQPTHQPPASKAASSNQHSSSLSASPSASPRPEAEENPPLPPKGGRARRGKAGQPTVEEHATAMRTLARITERSKVAYQGSDAHVRLITARLREGITEHDLRCVVAYCWAKSGLAWCSKDADGTPMARHLVPETLFGPQKVHKYLDPARDWFEREVRPSLAAAEEVERAPPAPAEDIPNVVQLRRAT